MVRRRADVMAGGRRRARRPGTGVVRTLDLFCGGGGSAWGARAAGAELVCGVDAWDLAAMTYEANFGTGVGVNATLSGNGNPALDGLADIDLIMASPECRNHTCAKGSRGRDEQSRATARYVLDFTRKLEPRWVIIENVIHMRSWDGFRGLITETEALGYHVREQVLDASDFGVPQARRRLFIVCDREVPPEVVAGRSGRRRSVRADVVMWNGPWESQPLYAPRRADSTIEKAERAIAALGRREPFLVVYYGSDGSGGWQSVDVPLRTLTTIDRFGLVTWDGRVPMLRMLQPPELQRAMGFASRYKLPYGSRRDRIKLLGNAVCPPVMRAVVKSVLRGETALSRRAA